MRGRTPRHCFQKLPTLLTFLQGKGSPAWAFPASLVTVSPGSPACGCGVPAEPGHTGRDMWDILRADVEDGISSSLLQPPSHPAEVLSGLRFLLEWIQMLIPKKCFHPWVVFWKHSFESWAEALRSSGAGLWPSGAVGLLGRAGPWDPSPSKKCMNA